MARPPNAASICCDDANRDFQQTANVGDKFTMTVIEPYQWLDLSGDAPDT